MRVSVVAIPPCPNDLEDGPYRYDPEYAEILDRGPRSGAFGDGLCACGAPIPTGVHWTKHRFRCPECLRKYYRDYRAGLRLRVTPSERDRRRATKKSLAIIARDRQKWIARRPGYRQLMALLERDAVELAVLSHQVRLLMEEVQNQVELQYDRARPFREVLEEFVGQLPDETDALTDMGWVASNMNVTNPKMMTSPPSRMAIQYFLSIRGAPGLERDFWSNFLKLKREKEAKLEEAKRREEESKGLQRASEEAEQADIEEFNERMGWKVA